MRIKPTMMTDTEERAIPPDGRAWKDADAIVPAFLLLALARGNPTGKRFEADKLSGRAEAARSVRMSEIMAKALAARAKELAAPTELEVEPVPARILAGVRRALEAGETHYTDRPGILELREKVAARLGLETDGVVITNGAREAAFVTGLALGGPGEVMIGNFHDLSGVSSFRVGFVAGPTDAIKKVRALKQALSICTAAPVSARGDRGSRRRSVTADEKRFSLVELAATLDDVISLGRGDPDLDTPPSIIEEAVARMAAPPEALEVRGLDELRRAIAARYRSEKALDFDPETEILVTNGAQEGLFLSVLALLDPGDTILVPDPRYGSYDQAIATAGGEMTALPTGEGQHFGLRPDAVSESEGGKVLLLVNPANPTGALTPPDDVRAIAKIARDRDLIVISDEVYEKLTFDEEVLSVAACEEMRERTVTLSSMSKTYAMTGFRIGYLIGPEPFITPRPGSRRMCRARRRSCLNTRASPL